MRSSYDNTWTASQYADTSWDTGTTYYTYTPDPLHKPFSADIFMVCMFVVGLVLIYIGRKKEQPK